MTTNVDQYFTEGCGRCELGGTPQCKVHNWSQEMQQLRIMLLDCGLTEESKWGVPCYTFQKKNVIILSAFKEYCSLSFFKGSLLKDTHKLLDKPGKNTQDARLIRFTKVRDIIKKETVLKEYILEAIEVEKSGLKVKIKEKTELILPEELQNKLDKNSKLNAAFHSLTPGRQKGYVFFFSAPKQSKTRESRIDKCIPQILKGKGLND